MLGSTAKGQIIVAVSAAFLWSAAAVTASAMPATPMAGTTKTTSAPTVLVALHRVYPGSMSRHARMMRSKHLGAELFLPQSAVALQVTLRAGLSSASLFSK